MLVKNERLNYSIYPKEKDIFLFTGNSYITKEEKLVMGRGAAKQVKDLDALYPNLDLKLGAQIPHLNYYGLLILQDYRIGVLQVKYHFREQASTELIQGSLRKLKTVSEVLPDYKFHCNYPGIGFGGLPKEKVQAILETSLLHDNITFYI